MHDFNVQIIINDKKTTKRYSSVAIVLIISFNINDFATRKYSKFS